jgi:hypothetical protein
MKLLQFFLVTATLFAAQIALAARPNYTYAGLGFAYDYLDDDLIGDCEQDGPFVEGSVVLNELTYFTLEHTDVPSSSFCGSTSTALGAGVRADVGGASSVNASLSMIRRDYGNDTDIGFDVDIGLRSFVASGVEAQGILGYEDIGPNEQVYVGAGVNYYLTRRFSVNSILTINDQDDKGIKLGLRFNF